MPTRKTRTHHTCSTIKSVLFSESCVGESDIILTKWFWQVFCQCWTFDKIIWENAKNHHFFAQTIHIWWHFSENYIFRAKKNHNKSELYPRPQLPLDLRRWTNNLLSSLCRKKHIHTLVYPMNRAIGHSPLYCKMFLTQGSFFDIG